MNLIKKIMNRKEVLITLGVVMIALFSIVVGYQLGWSPLAGENPPSLPTIPALDYMTTVGTDGTYSQGFDTTGLTEGWYTVKVAAGSTGTTGGSVYAATRVYIGSVGNCTADTAISSVCKCEGTNYETGFCCNGNSYVSGSDSTECNYGAIEGTLLASGSPTTGQTITIVGQTNSATLSTTPNGSGVFSFANVPADSYVFSISGGGYTMDTIFGSVSKGKKLNASLTATIILSVEDKCDDGLDNDSDSKSDCLDSDCDDKIGSVGKKCQYATEITCDDSFDNDGDGVSDCIDSNCNAQMCAGGGVCLALICMPPTTETNCSYGVDDDGDGDIDCADSDCDAQTCIGGGTCTGGICVPLAIETNCKDGLDDDSDGKTDCLDVDCEKDPDCKVSKLFFERLKSFFTISCAFAKGEGNCTDGIDNDNDGKIDCADSDCSNSYCVDIYGNGSLCNATGTCTIAPESKCSDGLDNDNDNKADCADSDCSADVNCVIQTETICSDGLDNDNDGKADCLDSDCINKPCSNGTCRNGVCTPSENTMAACSDVVDNDGDGKADCNDPDCSAFCSVPVSGVTLDKQALTLFVNDGATLVASVNPANATNGGLAWSSSDNSVAEAVASPGGGKVTGKGAGQATITVTTEDGGFTAQCLVTVVSQPSCVAKAPCDAICGQTGYSNDGGVTCWAEGTCSVGSPCSAGGSENTLALCTDGQDNDADSKIDCLDIDCSNLSAECNKELTCTDDLDNDGDGQTDCVDADCSTEETGCTDNYSTCQTSASSTKSASLAANQSVYDMGLVSCQGTYTACVKKAMPGCDAGLSSCNASILSSKTAADLLAEATYTDSMSTCQSTYDACAVDSACVVATATVTGSIRNANGSVLNKYSDQYVYMGQGENWNTYTGSINSNGDFTFANISYGTYTIRAGQKGEIVSYGIGKAEGVVVDSANVSAGTIALTTPAITINSLSNIAVGETLTVAGTANLLPGEKVYITISKEVVVQNYTYKVNVSSTDMNNAGVPSATVTVLQGETTIDEATTDANGSTTFTLPAGDYKYRVTKSGFETSGPTSFTLAQNAEQNVILSLTAHNLVVASDITNYAILYNEIAGVTNYGYKIAAKDALGNDLSAGAYEVKAVITDGNSVVQSEAPMALEVTGKVAAKKLNIISWLKENTQWLVNLSDKIARNLGIKKVLAGSTFEDLNISLVDKNTNLNLTGRLEFSNTTIGNFSMPIFQPIAMGFLGGQTLVIKASAKGYVDQTVYVTVSAGKVNTLKIEMNSDLVTAPAFLNISPSASVTSGETTSIVGKTSYDLSNGYSLHLEIANLKPKLSILNPTQKYFKPGDTLPVKVEATASGNVENISFKTYDANSQTYKAKKTENLAIADQAKNVTKELDAASVLTGATDGKNTIYVDATIPVGINASINEMPSFQIIYDSKAPKLIEGKEKAFYIEKDGVEYKESAINTLKITQGEKVDLYSNITDDTSVTDDTSGIASVAYYVDGTEVCNYSLANGDTNITETPCEWDTTNLHSEVTVVATDGAGNVYNSNPYSVNVDTSGGGRRHTDMTAPGEVSRVTVQNPAVSDGTKLDLSWTNPTDSDLAGIKIYRSKAVYTNETNLEFVGDTADASIMTYRDTGLTAGTKYYYILRPYDNASTSNVLFSTTQYTGTPTVVGEAAEAVNASSGFVPTDLTLDLNKPAGAATVSLKLLANVENPTAEAITTSKSSDIANVPGSTSRVYKYFEIESNLNEANVDEVMVKFSVDKNWLIENQIDSKNVSFYHYVFHSPGVWEELEATQTSQDNDYYYYESWTSQLNGLYAIAGRPGHVSLMETLTGSISGLVFIDANSNGQKDETEIGAKDIIVELYVDDGDQILNTEKDKITLAQQTGADGRYNFNELEEGNYIVFISRDGLPENYELTSESDVLWLSMYQNENIENVNFGYYEVAKEDTARIDQIKQNRDKESTTYITKKIRRVAEASPIIRKIITQTEEKISITPAIVWAIIIVLVLIFLVWQLTRGVDCGHKK